MQTDSLNKYREKAMLECSTPYSKGICALKPEERRMDPQRSKTQNLIREARYVSAHPNFFGKNSVEVLVNGIVPSVRRLIGYFRVRIRDKPPFLELIPHVMQPVENWFGSYDFNALHPFISCSVRHCRGESNREENIFEQGLRVVSTSNRLDLVIMRLGPNTFNQLSKN